MEMRFMNRSVRLLAIAAALMLLFSAVGCGKLRARDELNKGVQSFKNSRYEQAIEHFKNAVSLDPSLLTARLYLGTAYMQLYIPGAETPDNTRNAQQAIDEFKTVLASNPTKEQKLHAIKSIASLYYNMKDFQKSKEYYKQAVETDPKDPETYYMLGVINWADTYKTAAEAKSKVGLKVDDPFGKGKDDQKACQDLRQTQLPKITEGISALDNALKERPEYEDAMAYMNLLYRRKADVECGDPAARTADINTANQWSDKTLATRKMKAEKQQQAGGITLDQPSGKEAK
jgi:tetratricopeptide (TPR) repeat protein